MAIIYSYPESANILGTDLVVGTTTKLVDNKPRNQTKNFSMINISNYIIGNIPRGTLTTSNDQNITLTLGGFPEDSLFKDVSISVGWSGLLQDNRIASSAYWNSKQDALIGNGLVKSVNGTISYITDSSINWNNAYDAKINSASVTGGATKTLTLNKQDGSTITASWEDESGLDGVGFVKANGTAISYDNSTYVPTTRTITINGVSQDLSSNRSWTVNSAAVWGSITGTLSSQTDLQNALNNKQDKINGTGIVYSSNGLISYITNNSSDWNTAYSDKINSASVTGTTTKTLTLNQQDGGTITASWNDDGGNISLTTNGTSGPATLSNNILNIPNYTTTGGTIAWGDITGTLSNQTDLQSALSLLVPYSGATANVNLGNYTISSGKSLVGSEANFTRFPNALSVVSNIPAPAQHNESLYIGLMGEAASIGATWASGIYGAGYTNANGFGRGTGVTGEGHVASSTDMGVAVGVRGYATDVHTGNYNIGLYGDAENGDPGLTYGGNVALFLANGNIVTSSAANKNWFLGGDLTFNGQGVIKTIRATNGAKFDFGGTSSQIIGADGSIISPGTGISISGGVISSTVVGGVTSFNTRTGAITLTSGDVTTALGYTPANDTNVVHKTGDETITGTKTFNNNGVAIGIDSNNNNVGTGIRSNNANVGDGIQSNNSGNGTGISSRNTLGGVGIYAGNASNGIGLLLNNGANGIGANFENSGNGIGIRSVNALNGTGAILYNTSNGRNLVLDNSTTASGMPFTISKNNIDKLTINDNGEVTGNKFIKTGGTSADFLLANGTTTQTPITLTTTGSTGNATLVGTTLNVPNYGAAMVAPYDYLNMPADTLVVVSSNVEYVTYAYKWTAIGNYYVPVWNWDIDWANMPYDYATAVAQTEVWTVKYYSPTNIQINDFTCLGLQLQGSPGSYGSVTPTLESGYGGLTDNYDYIIDRITFRPSSGNADYYILKFVVPSYFKLTFAGIVPYYTD